MLPIDRLEALARRYHELEEKLCDPAVIADLTQLRTLNKERVDSEPIVKLYGEHKALAQMVADDRAALDDPELRELAAAELADHEKALATLDAQLEVMLLPKDPTEERNTILEIRAGTGGE